MGTARLLETMDRRTSVVGRDFRLPCSDSDDSNDDVVYAEGHDEEVRQSLCPPVVAQTRPKEGCDPASPRRLCRGRDVLMEDSMVAVDTRRISIAQDPDVVSGIHVMPDCVPAVMPMLAAAPQAASEVAQTRPRGDCSINLLLPVDGSIEPLDDDAPQVLSSGREPVQKLAEMFAWFRISSRQQYP